jgi:hypothetical protein
MDPTRARIILQYLADGIDPVTGAPFPSDSPYQQADTVRALHAALTALDRATACRPSALDRPPSTPRPVDPTRPQAGRPWTPAEDQQLRDAFAINTPIAVIAAAHGRTRGAIASRLVKLGIIPATNQTGQGTVTFQPPQSTPEPPDRPTVMQPGVDASPPDPPTVHLPDRSPPPRNPKPDDDLPF